MQALERIMALLEVVADSPTPLSATSIAELTDYPLSTVSRLLHQLTDAELLVRPTSEPTYILGSRIIELARRGSDRFNLPVFAQPLLDNLRDSVGETVSLHVKTGDLRVCIASAQSRQPVARIVSVGQTNALLPSATGEVLLASSVPRELDELLASQGVADGYRSRLDAARERGWSIMSDEASVGLTAIAVGITDSHGTTIAALSCSGPSVRFAVEEGSDTFERVVATAREISGVRALSL
ncbi:IclR family transcriptional regulator [Salinibacterium sp. ZJ454]|uniref:IclR family transcriptional regulator n=1 Tax=Salinibacterium sp. ZJ454 TaxID=2708339 RepID=UPI00141E730B|nr:IclR family transcriptional regulator [Salinibacterium sp. ZJ454]